MCCCRLSVALAQRTCQMLQGCVPTDQRWAESAFTSHSPDQTQRPQRRTPPSQDTIQLPRRCLKAMSCVGPAVQAALRSPPLLPLQTHSSALCYQNICHFVFNAEITLVYKMYLSDVLKYLSTSRATFPKFVRRESVRRTSFLSDKAPFKM